jgi:uncharacterized protein (TIGR00369 family)
MDDYFEKELLPESSVPMCFGCGLENPSGIKLRFVKEGPLTLSARFSPPEYWTGWGRIMHGGFHAILLDEAMGWASAALVNGHAFVTKEMALRYYRPVYVNTPITIYGHVVQNGEREILVRGEIKDNRGKLLTESTSVHVKVKPGLLTD